mmetsp:Transcript_23915/g.57679  ORF Transcript_23915/g.57679 Transcript_23915/m.57679 type:complete len:129 (+) Transcript_23915:121-507(+)
MIAEFFSGLGFAGEFSVDFELFQVTTLANEFAFAFSNPIPLIRFIVASWNRFDSTMFGVWRRRPPRKPLENSIRFGLAPAPVGFFDCRIHVKFIPPTSLHSAQSSITDDDSLPHLCTRSANHEGDEIA